MAFSPKPVEIGDNNSTDDFRHMCDGVIDIMMGTSNYLANHAVDLHPRMVQLLAANGVDGQAGLFGRGSIATNHANHVYNVLRKAADGCESVAKLMQAGPRAWQRHIVEPVRQAEAERARHSRTLNV